MKIEFFPLPTTVLSLAALRQSSDPLCSLQLQDNISTSQVERTNDWAIVSSTSKTLWPTASFYLALNGRLFGSNGQACSFSPNLQCAGNQTATTTDNFGVATDGLLLSGGRKEFWFCPDLDGDGHHAEAAPLIYPPAGTLAQNDKPDYENCNPVTLESDNCLAESDFELDPQKVDLGSGTSAQQETTSKSGRLTCSVRYTIICIVTALFLAP